MRVLIKEMSALILSLYFLKFTLYETACIRGQS